MPAISELASLGIDNTRALIVSTPGKEPNQALVREFRIDVPLLIPASSDVMSEYKVSGTPFAYLVSADGEILTKGHASSKEMLKGLIRLGSTKADRSGNLKVEAQSEQVQ